jgi:hypothetical protein
METIKELIEKLEKLTWVDYIESTLISKEGFTFTIEYLQNIGENKDTNQLLLNVRYKESEVYTTASVDYDTIQNVGLWFSENIQVLDEERNKKENETEKEGKIKFENL